MISEVRKAASKKLLFLPHAVQQMSHPERMISPQEVRAVIAKGEVIEEYADDARGQSCLLLGHGDNTRPIHVVCSPKDDFLAIITAYLPSIDEWEHEFKVRKPK